MGLINCGECKKEISSKADRCPHCGAPVAPIAKGCAQLFSKIMGLIFGLIAFLIIVTLMSS